MVCLITMAQPFAEKIIFFYKTFELTMLFIRKECQIENKTYQIHVLFKDDLYFKARDLRGILKSKDFIKKLSFGARKEWRTLDEQLEYKTNWSGQTVFINKECFMKLIDKSSLLPSWKRDLQSWISETVTDLDKLAKLSPEDLYTKIFYDNLEHGETDVYSAIVKENAKRSITHEFLEQYKKIRIIQKRKTLFCFKILARQDSPLGYLSFYGEREALDARIKIKYSDYKEVFDRDVSIPLIPIITKIEETLFLMKLKATRNSFGMGNVKLPDLLRALNTIKSF